MRRNISGRGQGRQNMNGSGPLMTNHLKDIDMELELLKRKRAMIEQQQQLLSLEQQIQSSRQYSNYNQSHSYESRYDEPQQQYSYKYEHDIDGPPYGGGRRKRPGAEPIWEPPVHKKVTPNKKKNKPFFSSGSGYDQGPHRASDGFAFGSNLRRVPDPGPSPRPQGPKPFRRPPPVPKMPPPLMEKKFQHKPKPVKGLANKITKPKASAPLQKIASQPIAERKKLVAAGTESIAKTDALFMLLPDRVPTQQVSGRLELALGAIMKDIRDLLDDSKHANALNSNQLTRVMKQAIRERIRTVMLGKVVGGMTDILEIYRKEYPKETDMDIVNIGLEAGGFEPLREEAAKLKASDDPEEFFKVNMTALIESNLREMFDKLEEIYINKEIEVPACVKDDTENVNSDVVEKTGQDTAENGATQENTDTSISEENGLLENSDVNMSHESGDIQGTDTNVSQENEDGTVPQESADANINNVGVGTDGKEEQEDIEPTNAEVNTIQNNANLSRRSEHKDRIPEERKPWKYVTDEKSFMNASVKPYMMKRYMPRLLKRYVPYLIKLMNVDKMFLTTKAAIITKTNEKAQQLSKNQKTPHTPQSKAPQTPSTTNSAETTPRPKPVNNLPYYVKVMGLPTLPKRKVMQSYLEQFNPKSIKKHKFIHNLLFVGFSEKSEFDLMVAANGTPIGKSKLSIRVCDDQKQKQAGSPGNKPADQSLPVDDSKKDLSSEGDIISPEMEGQITDLLSTIRKSEELHENGAETAADIVVADAENIDENEAAEVIEENVTNGTTPANEENAETQKAESEPQNAEAASEQTNGSATSQVENVSQINAENKPETDRVAELKSTPSRTSARLANTTPSSIRTRRASRLANP